VKLLGHLAQEESERIAGYMADEVRIDDIQLAPGTERPEGPQGPLQIMGACYSTRTVL
jgi:hypothetical protein